MYSLPIGGATVTDGTSGHRKGVVLESCAMATGHASPRTRLELLHGTLDSMVLQTLDTTGPHRGDGLARRIEPTSGDILRLNEGTVDAALAGLIARLRGAEQG
jgi:hypothetical protein